MALLSVFNEIMHKMGGRCAKYMYAMKSIKPEEFENLTKMAELQLRTSLGQQST